MSEHKINTTRYWVRHEPDNTHVFFITESNAAHSRAEGDTQAEEVTQAWYEENVPEEARSTPFNATAGEPVNGNKGSELPPTVEQAVIERYRTQCVGNMIGVHQQVVQTLLRGDITHAERIFVLEMVKHELMSSMMGPQQAANEAVH